MNIGITRADDNGVVVEDRIYLDVSDPVFKRGVRPTDCTLAMQKLYDGRIRDLSQALGCKIVFTNSCGDTKAVWCEEGSGVQIVLMHYDFTIVAQYEA